MSKIENALAPDPTLAIKEKLLTDSVKYHNDETLAEFINQQLFIERLPQSKAKRMILLWVVVETPWNHLGGEVGVSQALMQINAYGDTVEEAREIAWMVMKTLDGFSGVVAGVHVMGVHRFSGVATAVDPVKEGTDQYRYIAIQDFRVSYKNCEKIIEEEVEP